MKRAAWILGVLLSLVFLVVACSNVRWDLFASALSSINYVWVASTLVALFAAMLLRAARWYFVTGLPRLYFLKVWEAACIGYIATAIYPARAGDVLRMLHLQKKAGIGGGLVIGSSAVDRILDGLSLGVLFLLLIFLWVGDVQGHRGFVFLSLTFVLAACAGIWFVFHGHRLRMCFQRLAAFGRFGARLNAWYEQGLSGLQVLRSPRRIAFICILQGIISFLDVFACWLLFLAFGWSLSFLAALVVLIYLAAAISLPSSPGYIGVYQVAALIALKNFGIEESLAVAYGTLLQVLTLGLFIVIGGWAHLKSLKVR